MHGYERDRQLLHDLVKETGLRPAALAREAGVAVTTINRPYSGSVTTRLSRSTVEKLRSRWPYFAGWQDYIGSQPERDDAVSAAYTVEELGWLDLLRGLHPHDRELILQTARRFRGDGPMSPPPTVHDDKTVDFWGERRDRKG